MSDGDRLAEEEIHALTGETRRHHQLVRRQPAILLIPRHQRAILRKDHHRTSQFGEGNCQETFRQGNYASRSHLKSVCKQESPQHTSCQAPAADLAKGSPPSLSVWRGETAKKPFAMRNARSVTDVRLSCLVFIEFHSPRGFGTLSSSLRIFGSLPGSGEAAVFQRARRFHAESHAGGLEKFRRLLESERQSLRANDKKWVPPAPDRRMLPLLHRCHRAVLLPSVHISMRLWIVSGCVFWGPALVRLFFFFFYFARSTSCTVLPSNVSDTACGSIRSIVRTSTPSAPMLRPDRLRNASASTTMNIAMRGDRRFRSASEIFLRRTSWKFWRDSSLASRSVPPDQGEIPSQDGATNCSMFSNT